MLVRAERAGKGPTPSYDASAASKADADALKIPIRLLKLPDGRQANSGSRKASTAAAPIRPRASGPRRQLHRRYLAPRDARSLTQSNADDELVAHQHRIYPTGTQDVDGGKWWRTRAAARR